MGPAKCILLLVKDNDINCKSGVGAAPCPFHKEMDAILGTQAASNPVQLSEKCDR